MTSIKLAKKLIKKFGKITSQPVESRDEVTVEITDASQIAEVCAYAKSDLGFNYLVDLSAVDNYGDDPRFEIVYELYGYAHFCHLRLRVRVSEEEAEVPSVIGVWRTADWHEREAYDMMGVSFAGHPDLRRILMWDGYPYFPLRKDFPLAGKPSDMPDVAFTGTAPLEGGPFVTSAGGKDTQDREPRSRSAETLKTQE